MFLDLTEILVIRGRLAKRVKEEAEKLGFSIDEYLIEVLSQDLDPRDRAQEYGKVTEELLEQAREELEKVM